MYFVVIIITRTFEIAVPKSKEINCKTVQKKETRLLILLQKLRQR